MGDGKQGRLSLGFDARVRLDSRGSKITADAGLLAYRELGEQLRLTEMPDQFPTDHRTGHDIEHQLAPLVRQSVYSRLTGYPDPIDADGLPRTQRCGWL